MWLMPVGARGGCVQSSRASAVCARSACRWGQAGSLAQHLCASGVLWACVHRVLLQTGASEHCWGREPCLKHARMFLGSPRESRLQPLLQQVARLCCLHWPPCQGLPPSWTLLTDPAGFTGRLHMLAVAGSPCAQATNCMIIDGALHAGQVREESWWLVAGDPASNELYALKRYGCRCLLYTS